MEMNFAFAFSAIAYR